MRRWILSLLIFACPSVFGIEPYQVVKVTSGLCGSKEDLFHGSGFAFTHQGKDYVLTSEHVLLHGNGRFCHYVWNAEMGTVHATLKVAEYGNGLALLELEKATPGLVEFKNILPATLKEGLPLRVTGYAFSQDELISKNPGRILVAKSTRKYIPLVPEVIETVEAYGEFGMSGGPVFGDGNSFVGVLSHQYVRLIPGQKAVVAEFGEKSVLENHLLVIPAELTLKWVDSILRATGPVPSCFVRDPDSQIKRRAVILSSGVRFEFVDSAPGAAPVGGADGAGGHVGGADGAGGHVGGGSSDRISANSISMTSDVQSSSTVWFLPRLQDWLVKVRENLNLPWNTVEVPFFLGTSEDDFEATKIDSLADFFQKLMRTDLEPVTLVHSSLEHGKKEDAQTQQLHDLGDHLIATLTALKAEKLPPESTTFLSHVEIVAGLLKANAWAHVKKTRLKNLANVKDHGGWWKPLFDKNFDRAVELLEDLNKTFQLIEDLKA